MTSLTPTQFYALFFGMSAFFGLALSAVAYILYRIIDLGRRWVIEVPGTPGALAAIKRRRLKRGATYQRPGLVKGEKEVVVVDPDAVYPTIRGPLHIVQKDTGYSLIAPNSNDVPANLMSEEEHDLQAVAPFVPKALHEVLAEPDEARRKKLTAENEKIKALNAAGYADWKAKFDKLAAENETIRRRNADRLLTWVRMVVSSPLLFWKAIRTNDWQDWLDTQTGKPDWRVQIFPLLCITVILVMVGFCWLAWQIVQRGGPA